MHSIMATEVRSPGLRTAGCEPAKSRNRSALRASIPMCYVLVEARCSSEDETMIHRYDTMAQRTFLRLIETTHATSPKLLTP